MFQEEKSDGFLKINLSYKYQKMSINMCSLFLRDSMLSTAIIYVYSYTYYCTLHGRSIKLSDFGSTRFDIVYCQFSICIPNIYLLNRKNYFILEIITLRNQRAVMG